MSVIRQALLVALLCIAAAAHLGAQTPQGSTPRLVPVTGTFSPPDGVRAAGVETVTFSIYAEETGGTPIWHETQTVAIDAAGRYSAHLGATVHDGVPLEIFASGDARWLGIRFERAGEVEAPRVRLSSVPYALHAANAETLGGHPVSSFLRAPSGSGGPNTAGGGATGFLADRVTLPGTTNAISKYVNGVDIGPTAAFESGGNVGIGTGAGISVAGAAPQDRLNVLVNDTAGAITGFSVRNQGLGAGAFAGQLIYDQNGNVAFFQGFNNGTREFRQNNVSNVGGVPNGTINFMINSTSALFVRSDRHVGIGTTTPRVPFNVVRSGFADVAFESYNSDAFGGTFADVGRSRGTPTSPTPVLANDHLGSFGYAGFNGTGFHRAAFFDASAPGNWSGTSTPARIEIFTTPAGGNIPFPRMIINENGLVGINTSNPLDQLHVNGELRVLNCVKNSAGTAIAGACPSDRRFKRNITAFGSVLPSIAALRPVHYYWRATEFPEHHFGGGRTYGLIAQEVEEVLPELVVTNPDGYKAVDYSKLPLLTVQAIKELKAENDQLRARNEAMESRIAELERLVKQLLNVR